MHSLIHLVNRMFDVGAGSLPLQITGSTFFLSHPLPHQGRDLERIAKLLGPTKKYVVTTVPVGGSLNYGYTSCFSVLLFV